MELDNKYGESSKMNKFLAEILEQPKSLEGTLEYYSYQEGKLILKNIAEVFHKEKFQKIIFTGMGSSYFVSYAASCLFNSLGINSYALNTSELLYSNFSIITEKTLIVCISQSGESVEIVKLLEKLPQNIFLVGVSNDEKSVLSTKARMLLLTKAGREDMTSTKTYTSTILVLFILGWFLSDEWSERKILQIKGLITDTSELLTSDKNLISDKFNFFGNIEFLQFIGRGPLFSSALQSELMFKEASKIPAAAALGGEFRHGPMEMVKPGFKSLLFAAEGNTYDQSIKMAADIAKYQGKVLIITNKDPHISDQNIRIITLNQPDEYLFTIQSIIPVQLMVNYLALANGYVPGNFVHGGKVTLAE
jgi:glucosamine--fructose-6-phosphate aminotransferase (isomerizing)